MKPSPASPRPSVRRRNVEFAILGTTASLLALYAAITLNLKTPYTAALTAWVVANTRPGHVLSKSFHRVCGTLLGGVFSVVLVATLNLMPVLLFATLALWVGCFTAIGNLMRRYRSYFGFLAGYTAAFIVLGAYRHPDQVLQVGLDRTASIVVGVLSMSLVSAVAGLRAAPGEVEGLLSEVRTRCLTMLRAAPGMDAAGWSRARLDLNRVFLQSEEQLEYANLESAGFDRRARRVRALNGPLLELASASRTAVRHAGESAALQPALDEIVAAFEDAEDLDAIRGRLAALLQRLQGQAEDEALYPIVQWLEQSLPLLDPVALDRAPVRFPVHVDVRGACRHGLRTTLALLAAIAFWALSGWQDGAGFVLNCAAFCALMASTAHPGKSVSMLAMSALAATVAGFICKFLLLPHATGFPSLALCLAVVMVPLSLLSHARNPWIDSIGMNGGFLTLALLQPVNHMSYDPSVYFSAAISTIFATLFVIPAFSLILPTRPEKEGARLVRVLQRNATRAFTRLRAPGSHAWRVLAGDLLKQLQQHPQTSAEQLEAGLRAYDLGAQLLKLRRLLPRLESFPASRADVDRLLRAATRGWRKPEPARAAALLALDRVRHDPRFEPVTRHALEAPLRRYLELLPALPTPDLP